MSIIYNENEPRNFSGGVNIYAMNPHKPFEKHLRNWFYLDFIAKNSDDFKEKGQAEKELVICQRKIDYWKKHPNFERSEEERITNLVKKEWKQS